MIRLTGAALALTFAFAAGAPAYAADEKKPTEPAPVEAKLPDQARPKFTPTAGQASALKAVQAQIGEWVERNGTKFSFATQFDSDTGRIVINSDAPRDLLASLTKTDDPEAREAIAKAEINESRTSDTWNRRDDIQPFWGGAGISDGLRVCSSGYAVRTAAGYVASVTAGHCFANFTNVGTESLARSYGIVFDRRLWAGKDMELIGGRTYAGRVYTGGPFSKTSRGVANAGAAFLGYGNYCHSGRTTGEQCGHLAVDIAAQVCTQTGCKAPVIAFTDGTMPLPGDSGGAFYAIDTSGRAWIRGNVIAGGGGRGYVEPYPIVAAEYGATIVTG